MKLFKSTYPEGNWKYRIRDWLSIRAKNDLVIEMLVELVQAG